jgi:hypothetical protein
MFVMEKCGVLFEVRTELLTNLDDDDDVDGVRLRL